MARYWLLALFGVFLCGVYRIIFWPIFPVLWATAGTTFAEQAYLLALVTGLLVDITLGRTLGQTSGFMLVAVFLIYLYRLRGRVPVVFLIIYSVAVSFIAKVL